jgi:hypothetical protein
LQPPQRIGGHVRHPLARSGSSDRGTGGPATEPLVRSHTARFCDRGRSRSRVCLRRAIPQNGAAPRRAGHGKHSSRERTRPSRSPRTGSSDGACTPFPRQATLSLPLAGCRLAEVRSGGVAPASSHRGRLHQAPLSRRAEWRYQLHIVTPGVRCDVSFPSRTAVRSRVALISCQGYGADSSPPDVSTAVARAFGAWSSVLRLGDPLGRQDHWWVDVALMVRPSMSAGRAERLFLGRSFTRPPRPSPA